MKAREDKRRRERIKQTRPMPGDDDNDDLDRLPLGILRTAMGVMEAWRNCHRRACKRGRACRGPQVQCSRELPRRKRRGDLEKRQRDEARNSAIFQRMLRERMAQIEEREMISSNEEALPPKARKRTPRRQTS